MKTDMTISKENPSSILARTPSMNFNKTKMNPTDEKPTNPQTLHAPLQGAYWIKREEEHLKNQHFA
jgi:hypothetical protein